MLVSDVIKVGDRMHVWLSLGAGHVGMLAAQCNGITHAIHSGRIHGRRQDPWKAAKSMVQRGGATSRLANGFASFA
jgi:hypothetical protein